MIKLTALHYKLSTDALERHHKINELAASQIFDWELARETAISLNSDYPEKPFIEPFEFIDSDYEVTEQAFRVRLEDINSYKINMDKLVEITFNGDKTYTVKESLEYLDELFGL